MKQIYLIRHCKAAGQAPDAPLTAKGERQAEQLAQFFNQIDLDRMISSPFLRAKETAKPIAQMKNLTLEIDDRLKERVLSGTHLPDWQEKLESTFSDLDVSFEGGESSRMAMNRGLSVIDDVLKSGDESVALVMHGGIMSIVLHNYDASFGFKEWQQLTNPDVYRLNVADDQGFFERIWKD